MNNSKAGAEKTTVDPRDPLPLPPLKKRKKESEDGKVDEPLSLREVCTTEEAFVATILDIKAATSALSQANEERLRKIYRKYLHTPVDRVWRATELRSVSKMLQEIGFDVSQPVELNELLGDEARMKNGQKVPEANLFLWEKCALQLGLDHSKLKSELDDLEVDKTKWSRRSPQTGGKQNKNARWNCCFTDLSDKSRVKNPKNGDITKERVRHKHPKNETIVFTNYAFEASAELDKFRKVYATVLGPYGYKFRGQFAELNKYHDIANTGIGRHGDIERGEPGAVNCLKVSAL